MAVFSVVWMRQEETLDPASQRINVGSAKMLHRNPKNGVEKWTLRKKLINGERCPKVWFKSKNLQPLKIHLLKTISDFWITHSDIVYWMLRRIVYSVAGYAYLQCRSVQSMWVSWHYFSFLQIFFISNMR